MAQDLNSVTLVGRLARDPELRSTGGGSSVADLRLAFTTSRKSGGEWVEDSNFVNVTVWGAQGEAACRNLAKGSRIGVQGRLQHRTWQDRDGNNREGHTIVAHALQYLDPKPQNGGGGDGPRTRPVSQPVSQPDDDDIPF